jgi:hypothetical protein
VYYKFTMSLRDLKSGRLIWADEKEIRKQKTGPSSEADMKTTCTLCCWPVLAATPALAMDDDALADRVLGGERAAVSPETKVMGLRLNLAMSDNPT